MTTTAPVAKRHCSPAAPPAPATCRSAGTRRPGLREFEQQVVPHREELYACALRYTRNPAEAEDLVQEVMMRAFDAWSRFVPGSNARAWAFRILTNSFINNYRKRRRHARFASERYGDALNALYGPTRPKVANDPKSELVEDTLSDEVLAALAALGEDYRQVVLLADLRGVRYREIADSLDIPIGTVMSRLFRARRQLEQRLADFAAADYGIRRAG